MAERRMFAKAIIDGDDFLDMPLSTQALYFHLAMRADDEGFVNSQNKILRTCGASKNDMDLLYAKRFVIPFQSGVCVIKHWYIHNYIQKDRVKSTNFTEEKALLGLKENKSYRLKCELDTECIQDVYSLDSQYSIGKDSIGKVSINAPTRETVPKFLKPSLEEIKNYCLERQNGVNAEKFFNYYESNGWKVGKNSMKDWRAAVRTWEADSKPQQQKEKAPYA